MIKMEQALYQWTSDTLKKYVNLFSGKGKPTRKGDRVDYICQQLLQPNNLTPIWKNLDPITQQAISNAYHNNGVFDSPAFLAQYDQLPPRPKKEGYASYYSYKEPILFDLFVIDGTIPVDLMPLLANLVLPVERFKLEGSKTLPTSIERWQNDYPIIAAETEMIGRGDFLTYLQMVDQGTLKWSSKNKDLTAASIRKLYTHLIAEDFHPEPEKVTGRYVIRPFGLDTFAQGAKLVTGTGKLTPAGRKYLQTEDPDLFLDAFEKWTETGKFDEITRIEQLNGLKARGTRLSPPASRREKVIEALSWCPTDVWINIFDFYRAIKIWQFDFEVETTNWSNLYTGPYKQYGEMYGETYWLIVKGLYINAIIFEYLATIGAVDVGYVTHDISFIDTDMHYTDEALSLHDGLLYFRINNWGAFLLGQADAYIPSKPRAKELFVIDENRQLRVLKDMQPNEKMQLESLAEKVDKNLYQLRSQKILTAVESGKKLEHLVDFLESNHQGSLPAEVTEWLTQLEHNTQIFKEGETAVIVHIKEKDALAIIEQDSVLSKLCQPLSETAVLVLNKNMHKIRNRLKALGYLLN